MDLQNLAYALTQVIHNFGAVAVVGGAATALWLTPRQPVLERSLAWLVGGFMLRALTLAAGAVANEIGRARQSNYTGRYAWAQLW